jgi:hypothetical protein
MLLGPGRRHVREHARASFRRAPMERASRRFDRTQTPFSGRGLVSRNQQRPRGTTFDDRE